MAKVIFVLQRKPGTTPQECTTHWAGEHHTSLVGKIPGLTAWAQNRVLSAPDDPVCDGVGELWFDDERAMQSALSSREMAAAIEDAKRFLDMETTGMVIVEERTVFGTKKDNRDNSATRSALLAEQLLDAWNTHDAERVVDLLTDDHVYEDVPFAIANYGATETRGFFEGVYRAFPDIHFTPHGIVGDAERAVMEWTMTGTHMGDMPGLSATGKPFTVRGATVIEAGADKIRSVRDYWDFSTLLRQLGRMPEGASSAS